MRAGAHMHLATHAAHSVAPTKAQQVLGLFVALVWAVLVQGLCASGAWAQFDKTAWPAKTPTPTLDAVDLQGKAWSTTELAGKVVVLNFWATWCAPCKKELNTIHEVYDDWVAETGVTLVAIAIDDEKTKSQVPVYVNGKAWDYTVLMDPNWDFKRAMGVNNVPHTFLVDKNGVIVYSHNNYAPGDEEKLYQELLKLSEK